MTIKLHLTLFLCLALPTTLISFKFFLPNGLAQKPSEGSYRSFNIKFTINPNTSQYLQNINASLFRVESEKYKNITLFKHQYSLIEKAREVTQGLLNRIYAWNMLEKSYILHNNPLEEDCTINLDPPIIKIEERMKSMLSYLALAIQIQSRNFGNIINNDPGKLVQFTSIISDTYDIIREIEESFITFLEDTLLLINSKTLSDHLYTNLIISSSNCLANQSLSYKNEFNIRECDFENSSLICSINYKVTTEYKPLVELLSVPMGNESKYVLCDQFYMNIEGDQSNIENSFNILYHYQEDEYISNSRENPDQCLQAILKLDECEIADACDWCLFESSFIQLIDKSVLISDINDISLNIDPIFRENLAFAKTPYLLSYSGNVSIEDQDYITHIIRNDDWDIQHSDIDLDRMHECLDNEAWDQQIDEFIEDHIISIFFALACATTVAILHAITSMYSKKIWKKCTENEDLKTWMEDQKQHYDNRMVLLNNLNKI